MSAAAWLARIPLFAGLSRADLDALAAQIYERSYQRGAVLFREGEPGDAAYVVHEGRVKVYQLAPSGNEQIMGLFGPGDPFGLVTALDRSPYPATAETTEESRVWVIPNEQLQRLMAAHPGLSAGLLREVGSRLRHAQERVLSLAAHSVHQRLAAYLLDQVALQVPDTLAGSAPVAIRLTLTHQELGGYVGASRETVTRALADLRRAGAIQSGAGDTLIVDPERLKASLEG